MSLSFYPPPPPLRTEKSHHVGRFVFLSKISNFGLVSSVSASFLRNMLSWTPNLITKLFDLKKKVDTQTIFSYPRNILAQNFF